MDKFLDTVKKGLSVMISEAGKLTKTVAGKTNNLVDVTKLNVALSNTEKKISALYEKIGEMVYAKQQSGELSTSEFDELCDEISAFVEEQAALKAQIAQIKNAVTCPECGTSNDRASDFCTKCGAKLTADDDEDCKDEDKVIEVTEITEE